MVADINILAEQLVSLTIKEVNDLSAVLKDKYGIEAAVAAAPVVTAVSSDTPTPAAEKSSYSVILKNAGNSKLQVIKIVKEVTGLGLKEAKDLVDAGGKAIKENIDKSEAEGLKKRLEDAGAEVELN